MTRHFVVRLLLVVCLAPVYALGGGPLVVGGPAIGTRPAFGIDGQPFIWNPAKMPIAYRIDPGPLAATAAGTVVVSNDAGVARLQNIFAVWQAVPTAAISFSNAGPLLPAGSYTGGDLKTVLQFNDVSGSCKSGAQSPIIFDADASILTGLGLPSEVIGFAGTCALDTTNGFVTTAMILMNGKFQDGVDTPDAAVPNFELTANEFDEAFAHEIGHFIGLGHSQINLDLLLDFIFPCDADSLAGLPLMFPISICQARKDAGLPLLSPDDISWISSLYPSPAVAGNYATISGTVFFPDGASHFQGANVIARQVDDPNTPEDESRSVAVSAVSGYLFTGNPGQSVTANMPDALEHNTNGSPVGSRTSQLIGHYQIMVPPGTYTIEVESVFFAFIGGSGVGPLTVPVPLTGPPKFWNKGGSAFDYPLQRDTVTVHAGDKVTGIDIILNGQPARFDQFEDSGALLDPPCLSPLPVSLEVRG